MMKLFTVLALVSLTSCFEGGVSMFSCTDGKCQKIATYYGPTTENGLMNCQRYIKLYTGHCVEDASSLTCKVDRPAEVLGQTYCKPD